MDSNQLKVFAKRLLSKQEYICFKTALKSFEKNGNISDFCFDLLEMVNAPEKTELLVEARKTLPKSKQSEFSKICRDLVNVRWTMCDKKPSHGETDCSGLDGHGLDGHSPAKRARHGDQKLLGNALKSGIPDKQHRRKPLTLQQVQVKKENHHIHQRELPASRRPLPFPDVNGFFTHETATRNDLQAKEFEKRKVIRMERESNSVNFGFKIVGDLFTEREIIVRQVDENSIAGRAGLHAKDRITKINDIDCERARKSDIVKLIKSESKLKLTVKSTEHFKVAKDKHGTERAVAIATNGGRYNDVKQVTLYTNEDGWMGCSIRGGIDYDCEVHIISVADGSPAESAGLRSGDIIIEVNGVSLKGCTHVQAVNLILTSSPPISFTIKLGDDKHEGHQRFLQKPESQDDYNLPTTPLRINNSQRSRRLEQDVSNQDSLESPFPPPPPPLCGHWYQDDAHSIGACGVLGSPSALPLNTLHLDGTPPPPYTSKLPLMHRIIKKGGNVIKEERNHGLLPLENDVLHQNNRPGLFQNEEITTEQSRKQATHAVQHSTHKEADGFLSYKDHASHLLDTGMSSLGNTQVVFQDEANNALSIHKQALNNPEDETNVKPNSQSSLLEAIRKFNPGSLRPAKERNSSHNSCRLLPSSEGNDSPKADADQVKGNEGLVGNNENSVESSEADLRMVINQALMKRRADILDSSQESINESYCSEWDL